MFTYLVVAVYRAGGTSTGRILREMPFRIEADRRVSNVELFNELRNRTKELADKISPSDPKRANQIRKPTNMYIVSVREQ